MSGSSSSAAGFESVASSAWRQDLSDPAHEHVDVVIFEHGAADFEIAVGSISAQYGVVRLTKLIDEPTVKEKLGVAARRTVEER